MNGRADADALIVGAGIQGATLAWEMARRGLRAVVVERAAPGDASTGASFGLLHGGLRYLQQLDAARWARSRREQGWFLSAMPALVQALPVAMPLYRGSLRAPALFRAAFAADRWATSMLPPGTPSCAGRVDAADRLPRDWPVARSGLLGVARWQEHLLSDARAAVRHLLQRAGSPLVRGEPAGLIVERGRVAGLEIREAEGVTVRRAPVVVLCAGAGTRALARRFDRDRPSLSCGVLAFNLLLDRPAPGGCVLGLSPTPGRGRSFFFRPEGDRLLAGTWYAPWTDRADGREDGLPRRLPPALLEQALADVRACLPAMEVPPARVLEARMGLLPDVDGRGTQLRTRDIVVDHGAAGGPAGLWSVLGVKLTTARALSETAVQRIWPARALAARAAPAAETSTGCMR